jgi:G3E family GTPase
MSNRIPVHLICGFLGSGKTTLLRRILAEQPAAEKLVVLVNEFGDLGIDGSLLGGFDSEVLELTSGCICCVLKADFIASMRDLIQTFSPERIIVEASGLAETGDLSQAVEQLAKHTDAFVASVANVVDAEILEHRDILGPLFFNQIKHGDLLILNKTDLVDASMIPALTEVLMEINPKARVMPVVHCAVDRNTILAPLREPKSAEELISDSKAPPQDILPDLTKTPDREDASHDHHHDHCDFVSFAYQSGDILNPECLNAFLNELPWEIFRLKGYIRLPQGPQVLNYTYRRPEFTPINEDRPNKLVFIGWKVKEEDFLPKLKGCVST